METKLCGWCGEELSEEERENPFHDDAGEPICDECYSDHFEFRCCRCENYEHVDYQDEIGNLLVIQDDEGPEEVRVGTGIYRILKHPYYQVELLGPDWAYRESLELVTPHLNGADPSPYPAGHLCRDCTVRLGRLRPPRVNILGSRIDAEGRGSVPRQLRKEKQTWTNKRPA